jgi:ABC-2 type transport system permease protein
MAVSPTALIVRKTWRELRLMVVVYTLILELQIVLAISLWPTLKTEAAVIGRLIPADFIKRMVAAMTDPSAETAYNAYMAVQMFFKGTNVVAIAFAVLLGTGMIARERENLTLEFLLARPVSRRVVLLAKFTVVALAVAIPIYVTNLSGVAIGWLIDEELRWDRVLVACTHASAFALLILAGTAALSVVSRSQVHVAFGVGALIVVQVCIYFIQKVRVASLFRLADFDVFGPVIMGTTSLARTLTRDTLPVVGAALVLYLIADRLFQRVEP